MNTLLQDLRYAVRSLRKNRGFTAAAVLTLALGIGATSAVFSAIDAVLLSPLPYPDPGRLVRIYQQNSPTNRWTISNADWQAIREQQRSFEVVALVQPGGAAVSTAEHAEWVRAGRVTADFFRTLGVEMLRGHGFHSGDDEPGRVPGVVVTAEFAERHFGGIDAVGRSLVLDRTSHTVVGVLHAGTQRYAGVRAEVWPILQLEAPTRRGPFGYIGIGRLRVGVTLEDAARDLAGISERIYPLWAAGFADRTARLTPYSLREVIVGDASHSLSLLAAAVVLVLLLTTINVANLVLVRSSRRARELAMRSALGASRSRLSRLLLTESLVLGVLGGTVGLGVALLGLEALNYIGPNLPRLDEAKLDLRVVGFATTMALLSGALVGMYPLLLGRVHSPSAALRSGDPRAGIARGTRLFQGALVVAEFALALPLLLGAGLLLRSFVNLQGVDPGFDARNLLTASLSLPPSGYPEPADANRFWDEALRRIEEVPGVVGAGLTTSLPPDNHGDTNNFDLVEKPVEAGAAEPVAPWAWVTPGFFATLGVPLLDGRLFEESDDADAAPVVVVSRAWAAQYFPGESALGKRLVVGGCRECEPSTVVGVVGDVKYEGLAGGGVAVYEPARQAVRRSLYLVVRTIAVPAGVVGPIRERVRSLDPYVPVHEVTTMEERLSSSIANPRRLTWLLGAFAAVAVVLAALGVFGVLSYVVAQQQKEIGVRLALGADSESVIAMVLRGGLMRAALGLTLGMLVALQGVRLLEAVLFDVGTMDPVALGAAPALLLAVALLASYLPARRAARVDPMIALRTE